MYYFDPETFRSLGHSLVDQLADYLQESIADPGVNVCDSIDENELYERWSNVQPGTTEPEELFGGILKHSIRLHHPHYLGHQISPPATIAALSGLLVDLNNNGMGVYEMGMAGTVLERIIVDLVAGQAGFPQGYGGFLTSGGSLGNLTALLSARNLAQSRYSDSEFRPALVVSNQSHYCMQRAARIMGLDDNALVLAPTDGQFRMQVDALPGLCREVADRGQTVIAVVGSACSTATGSYDDLKAIARFCNDRGIWFHVDGAHGGAALFSDKYRSLLDGLEFADSVVIDFHKLLLTPALATAVLFANGNHGYRTFGQQAEYLFSGKDLDSQWHNLALRTFECTKYMMSLKIYSIYALYGLGAWNQNVTTLYDLARRFPVLASQHAEIEVLIEPQSNIVCYRYFHPGLDRPDEVNAMIRKAIVEDGRFYIVQTRINNVQWLRSTIANALTTEAELNRLLEEVVRLGRDFAKQ